MPLRGFGLAVGLLLLSLSALAQASSLSVQEAWTRATPPGSRTGAGYLTVVNRGGADRLLRAESPRAGRIEIHGMSMAGGVMKMWHEKDGVVVAKQGRLELAPRGTHLMFFELGAPLVEGERVPVTLHFEKAGAVRAELLVMPIGSPGPGAAPSAPPTSQPASRPAEGKR